MGVPPPLGFAPKVDCEKLGTGGKKTLFQSQTEIAYTPFADVKGDFNTLFRVRNHTLLSSTRLYSPFMGVAPQPLGIMMHIASTHIHLGEVEWSKVSQLRKTIKA